MLSLLLSHSPLFSIMLFQKNKKVKSKQPNRRINERRSRKKKAEFQAQPRNTHAPPPPPPLLSRAFAPFWPSFGQGAAAADRGGPLSSKRKTRCMMNSTLISHRRLSRPPQKNTHTLVDAARIHPDDSLSLSLLPRLFSPSR